MSFPSIDPRRWIAQNQIMKDDDPAKSQKTARIIEAAVHEFQAHGFNAASMDQISARAGVSKRTLYKYFESKDNLFRSIITWLADQITDTLVLDYDPSRDVRSQLQELAWLEGNLLTSPSVMRTAQMLIGESFRTPDLGTELRQKIDKTSGVIAFLEGAAADGTLNIKDTGAAAEEFMALMKAKAFWPVVFGAEIVSRDEMHEIVEACVAMMIARYGERDA